MYIKSKILIKSGVEGYELQGTANISLGEVKLGLKAGYFYTKSTNDKKLSVRDSTFQKQIAYIPLQTGNAGLSISYRNS